MDTLDRVTYEDILRLVHGWPMSRRFSLLQDLLRMLAAESEGGMRRAPTLDQALGMLATDRLPPSDGDVQGWLDERRMQKLG